MNSSFIITMMSLLAKVLSVIVVITIMGFTKAYVSYKLGDTAIKNKGKVSLNPKKHFEIIGFFIFVFFNYGWTAPIDTSSLYYKNRKRDTILVCIIPLIVAILLAFVCQLISAFIPLNFTSNNILSMLQMFFSVFLSVLAMYFVNFAIFNLIPIYPLFGQKLFQTLLPANRAIMLSQYEKIFQLIVIFLLLSGLLQKVLNIISVFILNAISLPIGLL